MTSCSRPAGVAQSLDDVLALLDERNLREQIDTRYDGVLEGFPIPMLVAGTDAEERLLQVTGDFMAHMDGYCSPVAQLQSPTQGRGEAIALLEGLYRSEGAGGYDTAVLAVEENGEDAIGCILADMLALSKATARQVYEAWVCAVRVDTLPWEHKRELTAQLLDRWCVLAPGEAPEAPVEQLAYLCGTLVMHFAKAKNEMMGAMCGA